MSIKYWFYPDDILNHGSPLYLGRLELNDHVPKNDRKIFQDSRKVPKYQKITLRSTKIPDTNFVRHLSDILVPPEQKV